MIDYDGWALVSIEIRLAGNLVQEWIFFLMVLPLALSLLLCIYLCLHFTMSSGCSLCAPTGQCSAAYKNSPGQFCGNWFDMSASFNKPCCCPLNSVCNISPTQCMCHVQGNTRSNNYAPNNYPPHNTNNHRQVETDGSGLIIILLIVICCCMCCRKGNTENIQKNFHDEQTPMARAYPVQPGECPPSHNPVYHSYGTQERGSGAGAAVASGFGGLAAGTIIGDMMGRRAEAHNAQMFGGNFGEGYNVAGDSGGYDVVGDSGGYDIQGDS